MVWFENHQWAVTDYGLESIQLPWEYPIAASRLLETRGSADSKLYNWPVHLAQKKWIDIEAFIEAFNKALELHEDEYRGSVDFLVLGKSIDAARNWRDR